VPKYNIYIYTCIYIIIYIPPYNIILCIMFVVFCPYTAMKCLMVLCTCLCVPCRSCLLCACVCVNACVLACVIPIHATNVWDGIDLLLCDEQMMLYVANIGFSQPSLGWGSKDEGAKVDREAGRCLMVRMWFGSFIPFINRGDRGDGGAGRRGRKNLTNAESHHSENERPNQVKNTDG